LPKKAFEHAAAGGVHLIAQVKANQPALHHAIAALCETAAPLDTARTVDKNRRSRDEARLVEVFTPGDCLADTEWAGHVHAVVRVTRDVLSRSAATGLWRATSETAWFVSDIVLPAAGYAKAIRDHWNIENRSHYIRDTSSAEDAAVSAAIQEFSRVCVPSPPTSCASITFATSLMHDIASPSVASVRSSPCESCIER
jgi:hypothetical protein